MSLIAVFIIVLIYSAVLWVVVLVLYSVLMESLDFGWLPGFAFKSLGLVTAVAIVVTFVPYGSYFTLVVWWLGLMVIFKMDLWECKVLVVFVWACNYVAGLALRGLMLAAAEPGEIR